MKRSFTIKKVSILLVAVFLVATVCHIGGAQEDQGVQQKLAELQKTVEELKGEIPRIGYINRQEAITVFPQLVKGEREKLGKIEQEIQQLTTQVDKGEISESELGRQGHLLQARHLQARIEMALGLLNKMITSGGFSQITDRLNSLKQEVKTMQDTMANLIKDIEESAISPQKVTSTLNQVGNQQYKQLDNIITNLAELRITQITQEIAQEKGYDLVIGVKNVIYYRDEEIIDDLTGEVKERLQKELQGEEDNTQ